MAESTEELIQTSHIELEDGEIEEEVVEIEVPSMDADAICENDVECDKDLTESENNFNSPDKSSLRKRHLSSEQGTCTRKKSRNIFNDFTKSFSPESNNEGNENVINEEFAVRQDFQQDPDVELIETKLNGENWNDHKDDIDDFEKKTNWCDINEDNTDSRLREKSPVENEFHEPDDVQPSCSTSNNWNSEVDEEKIKLGNADEESCNKWGSEDVIVDKPKWDSETNVESENRNFNDSEPKLNCNNVETEVRQRYGSGSECNQKWGSGDDDEETEKKWMSSNSDNNSKSNWGDNTDDNRNKWGDNTYDNRNKWGDNTGDNDNNSFRKSPAKWGDRNNNFDRRNSNSNRGGGGGFKRGVCKWFKMGSCRHGDNCKFLHEEGEGNQSNDRGWGSSNSPRRNDSSNWKANNNTDSGNWASRDSPKEDNQFSKWTDAGNQWGSNDKGESSTTTANDSTGKWGGNEDSGSKWNSSENNNKSDGVGKWGNDDDDGFGKWGSPKKDDGKSSNDNAGSNKWGSNDDDGFGKWGGDGDTGGKWGSDDKGSKADSGSTWGKPNDDGGGFGKWGSNDDDDGFKKWSSNDNKSDNGFRKWDSDNNNRRNSNNKWGSNNDDDSGGYNNNKWGSNNDDDGDNRSGGRGRGRGRGGRGGGFRKFDGNNRNDDRDNSQDNDRGNRRWSNRNDGNGGGGERKGVCKWYKQGSCRHGDNCKFLHEEPNNNQNDEPIEDNRVKLKELCRFYEHQDCYKRNSCQYMHDEFPCKLFHAGSKMCPSGDSCKYSHAPLTAETKSLLEKYLDEKVDERTDKAKVESTETFKKPRDEKADDEMKNYESPEAYFADPMRRVQMGQEGMMRFPYRHWNPMMNPMPMSMDYMHRQRYMFDRYQYQLSAGYRLPRGYRGMMMPGANGGMPYNVAPMMQMSGQGMYSGTDAKDDSTDPTINNLAQLVVGKDTVGKRDQSPKRLMDLIDHPTLQLDDLDDFSLKIETDSTRKSLSSPIKIKSPDVPPGAYVPKSSVVQPNVRLSNDQHMMYSGYSGHPNDSSMMDFINMSAFHYFQNPNEQINYDRPWKLLILEVPIKVPYPLMNIETHELSHKFCDPRLKGHPSVLNSNGAAESARLQHTSNQFQAPSSFESQLSSPTYEKSSDHDSLDILDQFNQKSDEPISPGYMADDAFSFSKSKFDLEDSSIKLQDRSYLQDPRFRRKKVSGANSLEATEPINL